MTANLTAPELNAFQSAYFNRHTKLYSRIREDEREGYTDELAEELKTELAHLESAARKFGFPVAD